MDRASSRTCRICDPDPLGPRLADPAHPTGAEGQARHNGDLHLVLDLGHTPLANRLLRPEQLDEEEPTYPLELVFCNRCSLLQITKTVPPELLFRDYIYFSSFADTMLRHAQQLAEQLITRRGLTAKSLVVEAGSNDGYLLQHFARRGVPVLGIEPARNIAAVARDRGIDTVSEFFGTKLAEQLRNSGREASVFVANNVLAHVANLNDFVCGIHTVLAPCGVAVIEVPYAADMIERCEFDTIYHEHLCYFSLTALDTLLRRHGLIVADVERIPIHGGSLRVHVAKQGSCCAADSVAAMLHVEKLRGMHRLAFYEDFAKRVENLRDALRSLLCELKRQGKRLAAYGAAAKGTTLLNYVGIGRELLEFVVDRNTLKQGRYMPGVRLPIRAPEELLQEMPDYVLLLTWNFAAEILEQQAAYRQRGGRFIIPIPEPTVL